MNTLWPENVDRSLYRKFYSMETIGTAESYVLCSLCLAKDR